MVHAMTLSTTGVLREKSKHKYSCHKRGNKHQLRVLPLPNQPKNQCRSDDQVVGSRNGPQGIQKPAPLFFEQLERHRLEPDDKDRARCAEEQKGEGPGEEGDVKTLPEAENSEREEALD